MSDPTAEEWPSCERHGFVLLQTTDQSCFICDEIRAAVAAEREKALFDGAAAIVAAATVERERCASVDPLSIACPACKSLKGGNCAGYLHGQGTERLRGEQCSHPPCIERWQAAIRSGGEERA